MRFTKTMGIMAAVAVAGMFSGQKAEALEASFDPTGSGTFGASSTFTSFDWERGNVLANQVVPIAGVGDEFEVFYHASLQGFSGGNNLLLLIGLGLGREVTVVAKFRERVASVNPGTGAVSFEIIDSPDNFFQIYVDSTPDADEASGTGFNDGDLILHARPSFGAPSGNNFNPDFVNTNQLASNNTQTTVTGGGSLNLFAEVISIDSNYLNFDPALSATVVLTAVTDGNLNLFPDAPQANIFAFRDTLASDSFWDGSGYMTPDLGAINGLNGPDFQFTADASTGFVDAVVPEPMTASMSLIGLGGLLIGARRRRNA